VRLKARDYTRPEITREPGQSLRGSRDAEKCVHQLSPGRLHRRQAATGLALPDRVPRLMRFDLRHASFAAETKADHTCEVPASGKRWPASAHLLTVPN